jgi:hypothetical protein
VIAAGTGSGRTAAQQGSTLASSLVEVRLVHGARSATKKLPRSTTVGALKLLCERLFRVKAARQALLVAGGGGGGGDDEQGECCGETDIGGDDTKPLSYWELQV